MIEDILTVIWKEIHEILQLSDRRVNSGWLFFVIVLGAIMVFPIFGGDIWIKAALTFWVGLPLMFMMQLVADSFAGERERHTLETLLATRLPDRAILLGKYLAPIMLVWLTIQVGMLLSLIPLNIFHGRQGLLIFSPELLVSGTMLSFLVCMYISGVGVVASLYSSSVQSAQTRVGLVTFTSFLLPFILLCLAIQMSLFSMEDLARFLQNTSSLTITLLLASVLLVINLGLLFFAYWRFHRSRLV